MKKTHTGWSAEEDAMLLKRVSDARTAHEPLQSAFDAVATMTDRRPNSVRNRYYTQLRACENAEPLFVPFSESESDELIRSILLARAEGLSVRACTMRLADGDMRRMLRYQNKYRSILKNSPDRVQSIREDLEQKGFPTPDPYRRDPHTPRVGRPPKTPNPVPAPAMAIRKLLDALYNDLLAIQKGEVG